MLRWDKFSCFWGEYLCSRLLLPRILSLFQTTPVLTMVMPFKQWQKDVSIYVWQKGKIQVKYKILQMERNLYFVAYCLV